MVIMLHEEAKTYQTWLVFSLKRYRQSTLLKIGADSFLSVSF